MLWQGHDIQIHFFEGAYDISKIMLQNDTCLPDSGLIGEQD